MNFWERKLNAYLHDSPGRCLDSRSQGRRTEALYEGAGFANGTINQVHDIAVAADRLPFPDSEASGIRCVFDGVENTFRHPLSGEAFSLGKQPVSAEEVLAAEAATQPVLDEKSLAALGENEAWRARLFAHWRLWPKRATDRDFRMSLLPADPRIPDHSIWTHMQMVSALEGCVEEGEFKPAFLKFQLGPVQDFIAAARSTRDLWSGSYLLSWLMAAGMKALSAEVGPDAVIYPNLREQPLFDLHWRKELWNPLKLEDGETAWSAFAWKDRDVLTPNLPNVFLAVVPSYRSGELGELVGRVIQEEWKCIADSVWETCDKAGLTHDEGRFKHADRKERFDCQRERFLSCTWHATPWPENLDAAIAAVAGFASDMPAAQARQRVEAVKQMATEEMPLEHRDPRFYGDKDCKRLNNLGLGWSAIVALNGWQLDAVRQTRNFDAWSDGGWDVGVHCNKDALTGREEAVAGGRRWSDRCQDAPDAPWKSLFRHYDWLGASTLIKRVWHLSYLPREPWFLKSNPREFPMPNTRGLAGHQPFRNGIEDETAAAAPMAEKYFAVLKLDGDQMGSWLSGETTPPFRGQLTEECRPYFEQARFGEFLKQQRPLSPSYHLQFSESLSNFALRCARPIVEAFDGRLVYAGGDDVLALLPADTAIPCARALRMAFQGSTEIKSFLKHHASSLRDAHLVRQASEESAVGPPHFQTLAAQGNLLDADTSGFLRRLDRSWQDGNGQPIPFVVPGPNADCSVGIAIAHFKSPLQDAVRTAWEAERRAKREPRLGGLGRAAVAITLLKRSGEIVHWGAKWNDGGIAAYSTALKAMLEEVVSAKFPHRLEELAAAYTMRKTELKREADRAAGKTNPLFSPEDAEFILERDIEYATERQRGQKYSSARAEELQADLMAYVQSLSGSEKKIHGLIGLCQTVAFGHRTAQSNESAR